MFFVDLRQMGEDFMTLVLNTGDVKSIKQLVYRNFRDQLLYS